MSTSENFNVKAKRLTKYTAKVRGRYDSIKFSVPRNANQTVTLQSAPVYNGQVIVKNSIVNPSSICVNNADLPNYELNYTKPVVLMPYGSTYRKVSAIEENPFLVNENCTVEEGIASNFSSSNRMYVEKTGSYSDFEVTIKCMFTNTSTSCIVSNSGNTARELGLHNGKFAVYWQDWYEGTTSVETNKWYFVKLKTNNNVTTVYSIEADEYTYSTLPSLENWTEECSVNDFSFTDKIYLGQNYNYTSEYLYGSIDLTQSKILINNSVFWEYPQYAEIESTEPRNGCLYNYTDTGSAQQFDCYVMEDNITKEQNILLSPTETTVSISGKNRLFINTVSIPAHTVYQYSESITEDVKLDSVSIYGSGATLDPVTKVFTGYTGGESYLDIDSELPSSKDTVALFKVYLNSTSSSAILSSKQNSWWLGVQSGNFGGWIGGSFSTNYTVQSDKTYWLKIVNTTEDGFKLYAVEDNNYTYLTVESHLELINEPSSKKDLSQNYWIIGGNPGYSSENLHGSLYLGSSYLKINNELICGVGQVTTYTWTPANN